MTFSTFEHPVPQSLGNDDLTLDPGFVCDSCNQYFGSKVEAKVLGTPPFVVDRLRVNVPTKKGKPPRLSHPPHVELFATPFRNQLVMAASPEIWSSVKKEGMLVLPRDASIDFLTTRMLIKIGLELLLVSSKRDSYDSQFDRARAFARFPSLGSHWEIAFGQYPSELDLQISRREDELSPLITEQLYRYEMGEMLNGDIVLSFMFLSNVFACNLVRPSISDYSKQFNLRNTFSLREIVVTCN